MATSYSRHGHHQPTHKKTLPITMPSKVPVAPYPASRVAMSPPEYSDSSTSYSSRGSRRSAGSYSVSSAGSHHSGDYDYCRPESSHDVMDNLCDRMNAVFDPMTMDRSLAKQTQDSGKLNAKERELRELQERARARLKSHRVNFAQSVEDSREITRDLEYCDKKTSSMKSKVERHHSDAYAKSKNRSRHAPQY